MYDDYPRHLRAEPIDHRLTVAVEHGGREVIILTTEKLSRTSCIPCLREYHHRLGIDPGDEPAHR